MNIQNIKKYLAATLLCLLTPLAFSHAGDPAAKNSQSVSVLAQILSDLNHIPSAEQKAELQAIGDDASNSQAVRTIASAIHDMQHSVAAEDREKLQAIADDTSATTQEKELADILLDVLHQPDESAQTKLKGLQNAAATDEHH